MATVANHSLHIPCDNECDKPNRVHPSYVRMRCWLTYILEVLTAISSKPLGPHTYEHVAECSKYVTTLLQHWDNKLYICPYCDVEFVLAEQLLCHLSSHTSSVCDSSPFTTQSITVMSPVDDKSVCLPSQIKTSSAGEYEPTVCVNDAIAQVSLTETNFPIADNKPVETMQSNTILANDDKHALYGITMADMSDHNVPSNTKTKKKTRPVHPADKFYQTDAVKEENEENCVGKHKPKRVDAAPRKPSKKRGARQKGGSIAAAAQASRVNQVYSCDHQGCDKSYSLRHVLERHKRNHKEMYLCDFPGCGKKYSNAHVLTRHKGTHSRKDESHPFKCDVEGCDRSFPKTYLLVYHKRQIHSTETHDCTICKKKLASWRTLKIHMTVVHKLDKKKFEKKTCPTCDKNFIVGLKYDCHICDINLKERLCKCEVCAKITSVSNFTKHMRNHSEDRPCICDACGAAFKDNEYLKRHMEVHGPADQFQCHLCPAAFKLTTSRFAHIAQVHRGDRQFVCHECGKSLSSSKDLSIHMRLHTGERPYTCSHCPKTFIHRSGLTLHLRTHTGEKPYKCPECARGFSDGSNMRSHLRTHRGLKARKSAQMKVLPESKVIVTPLSQQVEAVPAMYDSKAYVGMYSGSCQCPACGEVFSDIAQLALHLPFHGVPQANTTVGAEVVVPLISTQHLVVPCNTHTVTSAQSPAMTCGSERMAPAVVLRGPLVQSHGRLHTQPTVSTSVDGRRQDTTPQAMHIWDYSNIT